MSSLLRITPAERDALQLLANGRSKSDIADALGVSGAAVDARLSLLFERMGVSGTAEAVQSAARRGLLAHPPPLISSRIAAAISVDAPMVWTATDSRADMR
jgi:DNA-binding CsgD family transcriptional regulator